MRRTPFLIGLLALSVVEGLPLTASAAEVHLYDLFREQVEQEQTQESEKDEPVIDFLRALYEERWDLSNEDVIAAIKGEPWKACLGEKTKQSGECAHALQNIQIIAKEEQDLRTFGRTLQRIAGAQESPLSEIPGRPFHLTTDLSGVINIWRAGLGDTQTQAEDSALIRTWSPEKDTPQFNNLRDAIERLVNVEDFTVEGEDGIAMVARYQYGVRLVRGDRAPLYPPPHEDGLSGPGTERQYLFKRWEEVEDNLIDIYNTLPMGDSFDPPIGANEAAYVVLPPEIQDLLPENLLVWMRIGAYVPGGVNERVGDVGFAWKYPLEPVLPSLTNIDEGHEDEPILGGRYPPEPAMARFSNDDGSPAEPGATTLIDGAGLCSMTLAKRGYLCRPLQVTDGSQCPDEDDDEDAISLVSCTTEEYTKLTVAGADVCRNIDWKQEKPQGCVVEFFQDPITHCGGMPASASFKEDNGHIGVCINEDSDITITYLLEHELVHAQQFCAMEAGDFYSRMSEEDANALCCRLEGEAHAVSCNRMIEDGVIANAQIRGIDVTPNVCMEMGRLSSCRSILGRNVQCATSAPVTADDFNELISVMEAGGNPKNLPDDFETATTVRTMDSRIAARVNTIQEQSATCLPGMEATYKNTIGNNACYIGQCVEESLELHRLTPGRAPAVVSDSAFPWDDPAMGDALANVLRSVPDTSPSLPTYRPRMVSRILENALCQLQGLPASTPPHLCAFSLSRRLALPLADGAATAQSLGFNLAEQRDAALLTEQLTTGLGSRFGTDMQSQYLRVGTRALSEIVALADSLLKDALSVTFPTNMCPLSPA